MEDLKTDKKNTLAVIAYHPNDGRDAFYDSGDAFNTRYHYYIPGTGWSIPFSVIDGSAQFRGGIPNGNMYSAFLPAFDKATAIVPSVDISISPESPGQVRVELTNTSSQALQGTLHIAVVERHRPYDWRDMHVLDFICRSMLPGPNGQQLNLAPSQHFASVQQYSLKDDWNYCSIVAFFQVDDKRIAQGTLLDIESSIPVLQIKEAPETGDLWLRESTHTLSWSSNRSLPSVVLEYSADGGSTWSAVETVPAGGNSTYSWKVPAINAARCLVSVRDPFGGARATSGLFAIGLKGDLNADGVANAADRTLLVDYLLENKAAFLPGADLNGDGMVDLFDLLSFDSEFGK